MPIADSGAPLRMAQDRVSAAAGGPGGAEELLPGREPDPIPATALPQLFFGALDRFPSLPGGDIHAAPAQEVEDGVGLTRRCRWK